MKPTFLMFYCIETSFNASLAFYIGAKCHQLGFYLNLHLRRQTLYQVLRFIRGQSAIKPIFLMFTVKKKSLKTRLAFYIQGKCHKLGFLLGFYYV